MGGERSFRVIFEAISTMVKGRFGMIWEGGGGGGEVFGLGEGPGGNKCDGEGGVISMIWAQMMCQFLTR